MLFLNCRYDEDPGMLSKQDVAGDGHWNLWTVRMHPFNELEDGIRIVLVDSWPDGSRLSWEVKATKVVTALYSSKRSAIRMIAKAVGWHEREVAAHQYTKDHPQTTGFVLAFRFQPVRRIGRPRPKGLRMRQHGWAKVDDSATLRRWGVSVAKSAR